MKETLETINRMRDDGVIAKYAIGGAVGATFYIEPSATLDVGVFVILSGSGGGSLVDLGPIYRYLTPLGYKPDREHIVIGTWPVQFLPAGSALEEEAVVEAIETDVDVVPTWVMTAEHLVAIALRTGRPTDHARILQFLQHNAIDHAKLGRILARHGLTPRWEKFRARYLDE